MTETLPESWGIRLENYPVLELTRVQVPTKCPRCKSTLVDSKIDIFRTHAMAVWAEYKRPKPLFAVLMLVMLVVTLGIWLIVLGTWFLLTLPMRRSQKLAAQADASKCVLSHCRSCGLEWHNPETAAIAEQNP